jgi:hypothetical protein
MPATPQRFSKPVRYGDLSSMTTLNPRPVNRPRRPVRKLTQDYRERPFVILGVNTDSPDTLRELCNDKKVTWRCWSDGPEGPIAREWQVDGVPTLYLLDHEGVIRQTFTSRPEEQALERAIRDLVEKAEKAKPRTPDPGK